MATVYWIRAQHHTDMLTEGYIGFSSRGTETRYKRHKKDSKREKCKHLPLYRAFAKYGDSLIISTLVEGSDDYCLMIEERLRPAPKIGWNILRGGEKGSLGSKRSKESCEKQSKTMTGKKHPKEFGEAISKRLKGVKKSPEHCANMSKANKGKKVSEETILKIKEPQKVSPSLKAHRDFISTCPIWMNPASCKEIWALAGKAYDVLKDNPKFGARRLGAALGVHEFAIRVVCNMLKSGWNPNEDPAWLDFKMKQEREATNA